MTTVIIVCNYISIKIM